MIGIYKITKKENGKSYIGQSNDIERRFSDPIKFKRSQKILDVILETNNSKVEKIFPISNMTKKEIWHYIP